MFSDPARSTRFNLPISDDILAFWRGLLHVDGDREHTVAATAALVQQRLGGATLYSAPVKHLVDFCRAKAEGVARGEIFESDT